MNRWIAVLQMTVLAACLAGTAMAATVKVEADRTVDMSGWKYAAWASGPEMGSVKERRIDDALVLGFAGRGYVFVQDTRRADFLVSWRAVAWQDVRLESGPPSPAFGREHRVTREAMGALRVTVLDRRTGKLAWQGLVSDALADTPEQADRKTAQAVEKLLRKFPASGGGR